MHEEKTKNTLSKLIADAHRQDTLLEAFEHLVVEPLNVELVVSPKRLNLSCVDLLEHLVRGQGLIDPIIEVAEPEGEVVVHETDGARAT